MEFIKEEHKDYFNSRKKKAHTIINEFGDEGIRAGSKKKVLEVGCNQGFITYHLSQLTKWELHGGDIQNYDTYPEFKKHISIDYLDATKMKYKANTFDVVILNHVIEHIPQWEQAINEIYRVLKKGGILYLATPNLGRRLPNPLDRWAVTKRVLFYSRKNIDRDDRMEYHRGFSAAELEVLLSKFTQVECYNKKHFLSNAPKPLKPLLKVLSEDTHKKYAQTCLFIAKK